MSVTERLVGTAPVSTSDDGRDGEHGGGDGADPVEDGDGAGPAGDSGDSDRADAGGSLDAADGTDGTADAADTDGTADAADTDGTADAAEDADDDADHADGPDDEDGLSADEVFHLLQCRRRRDALRYLRDADTDDHGATAEGAAGEEATDEQAPDGPADAPGATVEMRALAEQVAAWEHDTTVAALTSKQRQRVYIPLYQTHLPKLDDAGVIHYDKHRGRLARGPNAPLLDPYLDGSDAAEATDDSDATDGSDATDAVDSAGDSDAGHPDGTDHDARGDAPDDPSVVDWDACYLGALVVGAAALGGAAVGVPAVAGLRAPAAVVAVFAFVALARTVAGTPAGRARGQA